MKVGYSKFPEIPPGYFTNYNKTRDAYRVYHDYRVFDPSRKKRHKARNHWAD